MFSKFIGPMSPMPHIKSPLWLCRRRFLKGFYHVRAWWPAWSCDQDAPSNFCLHHLTFVALAYGGSIWNLVLIGPKVSDERMFEDCGRLADRSTLLCLYYQLTYEPKGSGERKISTFLAETGVLVQSSYFFPAKQNNLFIILLLHPKHNPC